MYTTVFAHNASHHIGYAINSLHSPCIIQDARPIIVDTLLMHIFRRWEEYYLYHFC